MNFYCARCFHFGFFSEHRDQEISTFDENVRDSEVTGAKANLLLIV